MTHFVKKKKAAIQQCKAKAMLTSTLLTVRINFRQYPEQLNH